VRVARIREGELECLGVVLDEVVRPLPPETDLLEFLAAEPAEREERVHATTPRELPLAELRLLAPLQPATMRDFVAFEEHVEGAAKAVSGEGRVVEEWYQAPRFYFTNPYAVIGSGEEVAIPPGCELLDFELEVAAIVCRPGNNLEAGDAARCIGGYTIFNDWSARDLQGNEMRVGLGPAKGKDFASTLGPWIVTPDELEQYRRDGRLDLDMEVAVNGEKIGDDTLANMGWSFEEMLVYASRGTWVRPGDVVGSGTCGAGCLAELWGRKGRREPPPLTAGDVVTMTVEGIGTISNRVVPGVDPVPVPRARAPRLRQRAQG
jgi:2-keto-4-pentenoate hydratase/2-oxohepta-3-ene-1,7-dioic acid hydratase in catechol pathway